MPVAKRLDLKLANIENGRYTPSDFIIADAKDGDMARGTACAGPEIGTDGKPTGRMLPLQHYRDDMERMIEADQVDIMLTSLSSAEYLTRKGAFANTEVTPAIRLNDGTDIWLCRSASYAQQPTRRFRTARLDRVKPLADLGLFAVTFYNDRDIDHATLDAYAQFRDEASAQGVRHFLEVFNPAMDVGMGKEEFAHFNNDCITRCLAGVARQERPVFLKMVYNGPKATEELASYDPGSIIVGILGGAFSTSRDTLEMIKQSERYGARVALFGRRIYGADSSVGIVNAMRLMLEEDLTSEEATKIYHDGLSKAGITPSLPLSDDLELVEPSLKLA